MLTADQLWDASNRVPVLFASAAAMLTIALIDWWTLPYVSLGLLYLFPIMLAAAFLPRAALLALGALCAGLSETFSALDPAWRASRLTLEALAFAGCGLFVSELVRNRRLSLEAQERLRILVETSPAAIMTVDGDGRINLANHAAMRLMAPADPRLIGQPIDRFVPELRNALQPLHEATLRTSMQCQGHRGNGETFVAEIWFSTYRTNGASALAAIIADVSEDQPASGPPDFQACGGAERPVLNSRQIAVLRLLFQGLPNSEIAARLDLTTSAVKNILHQLFAKAGVRNRSQMICVALERYRDLL